MADSMVDVNSKSGTKEVKGRRGRERKKKREKKKVVEIEACINRLPFFFPLERPTLWKIEDWNLNHLGPFSKVCNFYGRSLP